MFEYYALDSRAPFDFLGRAKPFKCPIPCCPNVMPGCRSGRVDLEDFKVCLKFQECFASQSHIPRYERSQEAFISCHLVDFQK